MVLLTLTEKAPISILNFYFPELPRKCSQTGIASPVILHKSECCVPPILASIFAARVKMESSSVIAALESSCSNDTIDESIKLINIYKK